MVNTIGATRTRTGLTVPDEVMDALPLTAHDWHGQWNYTLTPAPPRTVSTPMSRYVDRGQPDDRAPDWLHHPTIIGMNDWVSCDRAVSDPSHVCFRVGSDRCLGARGLSNWGRRERKRSPNSSAMT